MENSIEKQISEKEQFWKEQSKLQRLSSLSRAEYCRQNQLSSSKLDYWERKWRRQGSGIGLLRVKINEASTNASVSSICTLRFKNGHELKIHDQSILPMLLSLWG